MEGVFRFRQFDIRQQDSAFKVGTDAVLLGAAMTLPAGRARLLDIGTGTGVIALMAAQRCPEADIDAVEADEASESEAAFNFKSSPWSERLRTIHCRLQRFDDAGCYDAIFSNPPYFDNSLENPDGRKTAARHTESLSFSEICAFAGSRLSTAGTLSLVLPSDVEKALLRTAASFGLYPFRILRVRTTPVKRPKRIIAEFSRVRTAVKEEDIVIGDEKYRQMTGEFYLFCSI